MKSMRSLVRSVISEVEPTRAAFEDGAMQNFFSEVKVLVDGAFGAMENEVQSVTGKNDEWKQRAMERGLMFMANPGNEKIIIDSIAEIDDVGELTKLYFAVMHNYARDRVSTRDLMNVNYEPFGRFIAKLYRELAGDNVMKQEYFKTMSYTEKDSFLSGVLKRVMKRSVVWPTGIKPASVYPITPHDSVSQIKPPSRRQQSVAASKVGESVAKVVTAAATEELSPESLNKHNNRSRFSAFKTPSVVPLQPKVVAVSMDRNNTEKRRSVAPSCVSNE
jgi:hypothetical protein